MHRHWQACYLLGLCCSLILNSLRKNNNKTKLSTNFLGLSAPCMSATSGSTNIKRADLTLELAHFETGVRREPPHRVPCIPFIFADGV